MIFILKIIFMGTADFGGPVLKKLIDGKENIIKVITQPDRPQGRGRKLLPTPIKEIALNREIEVLQPENINDDGSIKRIKEFDPDLILVVAYGQILSKDILNIPKSGCLNIHASLLPKYRGAAPINWAIINGEKETGITFIFMNERVDAGDIIYQQKITILPDETYGELYNRLSNLSADIINTLLEKIERGKIKRISQESRLATFAKKMTKEDGEINWNERGEKIYNLIRGTTPYPGAFTSYKGKKLKITKARFLFNYQNEVDLNKSIPGTVFKTEKESLLISTADKGIIKIFRLIPAGSKELTITQFINGYKIKVGEVLG